MAKAHSGGTRADIQALRALAVSSVLLYHLWPRRLTGGFVGVDVFFVISGFLIGSHLLAELAGTGRVRLGRFWARRAIRLLPASLLVLLTVAVATVTVVPLSRRAAFLDEVVGATFYVQNWVLAHKAVDYLALGDAASPVQHYWTLSTEEQFYLLLPVLLLVAAWVAHRAGLPRRRLAPAGLACVGLVATASLAYSIHLTITSPGVAYFSTGTRAWEFLAGTLLAGTAVGGSRILRVALGWSGLAVVLFAVVAFDGQTAFPGVSAALPVVGTLALLVAREAGPLALLTRWRPVTWLGDVSYSVYLWHWPLIVILPYVSGDPLDAVDKVGIVSVALILAWASTRLVEDPVRFSTRLLGGGRRPIVAGGILLVATCLVAATALVAGADVERTQRNLQGEAQALLDSGDLSCLGAGRVLRQKAHPCADLGDALVPAPSVAGLDDHNRADCWSSSGPDVHLCSLGARQDPAVRVLAVGDSHNNVYLPAYEDLAATRGWQVDVAGRAGCAWSAREHGDPDQTLSRDCSAWKEGIAEHLAATEPYDLIITTNRQSGALATPEGGESRGQAAVGGYAELWEEQIARGSVVVALRDTPLAREDVVECVEREQADAVTECAVPTARAFAGVEALKRAVARTPGSGLVDLRDLICDDQQCLPVVGNVVVYRDQTHLTVTFVNTLIPIFEKRLDAAMQRGQDGLSDDARVEDLEGDRSDGGGAANSSRP